MNKKTVKDIDVKNKTVLVRVDFNVPLREVKRAKIAPAKVFEVADDTRIIKTLPTIEYLLDQEAKVVLLSHLGRPKGRDPNLSLFVVADHLGALLKKPVKFVSDCIGKEIEEAVKSMKPSDIVLLENTRFYPQEEKNDPDFAQKLASLADIFVNDAFATAHRSHASTVGVTKYLPSFAGLLMEKEVDVLTEVMENPAHPFVGIIGGAKISTKMGVIENLLKKVDTLLFGGALANTVLKAKGFEVGKSLIEKEMVDKAKESSRDEKLKILVDAVVASEPKEEAQASIVGIDKVPKDQWILDIGPETIKLYKDVIQKAQTIIWNGPMGVFEIEAFAQGTNGIAKAIVESRASKIVIGGGETLQAIIKYYKPLALANRRIHVSTGGGAMLEFLEGKKLPAIEALQDK